MMNLCLTSISGRYAKALFDLGKQHNCVDELGQNFIAFQTFLTENSKFNRLMSYAKFNNNIKNVLQKYVYQTLKLNNLFINFLNVLLKYKRFNLLDKISRTFHQVVLFNRSEREVTVYSAMTLTTNQKNKLKTLISKLFNEKSIIKYYVNKDILSGFVIYSNGVILDASGKEVIRQLESFIKGQV